MHKSLIFFVSAIVSGCCATIPPESVELSGLVGEMIVSAKVSHVNMANRHFDQLRSEVDGFALTEFKEAFMDNALELFRRTNPSVQELSLSQYERALSRVYKIRSEWMDGVEKNRQEVLQALEEHYAVMQAGNFQVMSMLRSAVDLTETRTVLLERFGQKVGISATKMKEVEDRIYEGTNSIRLMMEAARIQLGGQP